MSKNVVHFYFKKEHQGEKILVKLNPVHLTGTELRISGDRVTEKRDLEFSEDAEAGMMSEGFEPANAMEFNLYLSGLL